MGVNKQSAHTSPGFGYNIASAGYTTSELYDVEQQNTARVSV